jgi:anti-sigma factor RsiW
MTQCWPEGALRAYLDGELPSGDMERVAAHLEACTECDGLCTELAARAAHVSALMELLPECGEPLPWPGRAARAPRRLRNWAGIAVALAACLALVAYLLPDRRQREAVTLPARAPRPVTAVVAEAAPPPAPPAQPAPLRRPRRPRHVAPEANYFVALDDEPFESGVIMRVDVKPGNVQADIVFGPDGRAHAFRLVNAGSKGEYR